MPDVRRKLVVTGKVQGVFFRDACKGQAEMLGLRGWAKNLPDRRVEVVAEGDPNAIERLLRWCKDGGSTRSRITGVEATTEVPQGIAGFRTI
jgi:acylphosphatase